jgi:hypothetical protein
MLMVPLWYGFSFAGDPEVVDVFVEVKEKEIILSTFLADAFTQEIRETLASGAPITFTYIIQLRRERLFYWDTTEKQVTIKRMTMFDAFTKEYLTWEKLAEDSDDIDFENEIDEALMRSGKENIKGGKNNAITTKNGQIVPLVQSPIVIRKTQELEQWMKKLEEEGIGSVDELDSDAVYYIRVKAQIKALKLIPPFNYILFFLSHWNLGTDWSKSKPISFDFSEKAAELVEVSEQYNKNP